ncbi:TIGR03857 family LLM class F420-dependent oxidoreductase [Streptomyces pathocidini]|uniref:TIGR03857 family LLM class F420-dependent oxidoreductase n=1 Tax=Streptomyces pathocidini TaxID=1650571 RepID=UPI003407EFEA
MTERCERNAGLLGAVVLPGRVPDPRPGLTQAVTAERTGLGTVWLSERWGTKDLPSLAGAVAQPTSRIRVVGVADFQIRHPIGLASLGSTLQALTGGRFALAFGRGAGAFPVGRGLGLPYPTSQRIIDHVAIVRRLWAGETVRYDGPAGSFPSMRMADIPDLAPPELLFAAIGPRSLRLAGAHFDGVVLHPMLTPEAVSRSAATVRDAAQKAGRDPAEVRVYASALIAPELTPQDEDAVIGGRAVTYLQAPGYGELIARANGWDPAPLQQLRTHPALAHLGRELADQEFLRHQLADVSRTLPPTWLKTTTVAGSAEACARFLHGYLDSGADEIVINGTTPDLLQPTIQAFQAAHSGDLRCPRKPHQHQT